MPQSPHVLTCSTLFTPGRACPVTAVVLHEWKAGLENLDHEMCRCLRRRPLTSPGCHTSFNFGVGGNCNFRQYVPITDTAWGFYFIPTPVCPVPPCPIVQTCDGIGADQYNPQENGTLPTPVVVAGPDGTANCAVIHVAVATGAAQTGSGLYCRNSPYFSQNAYDCLVESLCWIFKTAGLTPNGYSNLLTHIDELYGLDLDQLAIDIQECIDYVPPPLPPCNCAQTDITVIDSPTLNLGVSGIDNHIITGNVVLSTTANNLTSAVADGLYTGFAVLDTPSVNLTKTGLGVVSADVIVSPTAGNQLSSIANGLFVSADTEVPITVVDTVTINLTANGVDNHTIQADVIVSPNAGNQLSSVASGLFVPAPIACVSDPVLNITAEANTNLNVTTQLTAGKQIFLIDLSGFDLSLINPPTALCQEKEIWIKNLYNLPLEINSTDLIDGQLTITLAGTIAAGYPFGNNGGEAVHLVWSTAQSTWFIV